MRRHPGLRRRVRTGQTRLTARIPNDICGYRAASPPQARAGKGSHCPYVCSARADRLTRADELSKTYRYMLIPFSLADDRILPMPSKPIRVGAVAIGAWSVLATAQ